MSNIKVARTADALTVFNALFEYTITRRSGGLPARIKISGRKQPVLDETRSILRAKLNGRTIYPSLRQRFNPEVIVADDMVKVIFTDIPWEDESGRIVESYRLALLYEIHDDGVVFVKTFFFTETLEPGTIQEFTLQPTVAFGQDEDLNWSYWEFPEAANAKLIQTIRGFGRNLSPGDDRHASKSILPFVGFDFGQDGRRDHHLEFFIESFNALLPEALDNTSTDITWQGKSAKLHWNFQKSPRTNPGRSYQWRNVWGWTVRKFPVERKHPPLRIYHYLDNFERYPNAEIVRQAAAQGANLLILHENWRLDVKQGEFPYDAARLKATIELIHKNHMRAALYVRGNEMAIREDFAEDLRPFLKKNWDGIYMDFGSPYFFLTLDEYSAGGRIQFREYYKMVSRIRELVGDTGVFLGHSGSFFAAMAHTKVDAYVAGEQEQGQLIRNKTLHAYYSGLSIAPSSLWTAAFPTYRSAQAIPYLASTAQTPFLILGTQLETCSLDHPKVPSIIRFQRPLWRLWELLDGKQDLRVYTLQNAPEYFRTDGQDTGVCLFVDEEGNCLLIATNFADVERKVHVKVDWRKLKLSSTRSCLSLTAGYEHCSWQRVASQPTMASSVEAFGVAGWLFTNRESRWRRALNGFARPYVNSPCEEAEHSAKVEALRKNRFDPPVWKQCFLKVSFPNFANTYEDSLWVDLSDNIIELQDLTHPARPRRLGYLSARGIERATPSKKNYLRSGMTTPWIPLHRLVAGRGSGAPIQLSFVTRRGKGEFYSFIKGELAPRPGRGKENYEIRYSNDIDADWSRLNFTIRLQS